MSATLSLCRSCSRAASSSAPSRPARVKFFGHSCFLGDIHKYDTELVAPSCSTDELVVPLAAHRVRAALLFGVIVVKNQIKYLINTSIQGVFCYNVKIGISTACDELTCLYMTPLLVTGLCHSECIFQERFNYLQVLWPLRCIC